MLYDEIRALSIKSISQEIGKTLKKDIKTKHLSKSFVAKKAGITNMSLYRLLKGENCSIDTLLRVLKVLEKYDAIDSLLTAIPVNPIDLYSKIKKKQADKTKTSNIVDSEAFKKFENGDL